MNQRFCDEHCDDHTDTKKVLPDIPSNEHDHDTKIMTCDTGLIESTPYADVLTNELRYEGNISQRHT